MKASSALARPPTPFAGRGDRIIREGARAASFYARVYAVVRTIPRGRVATYGQVAARLGVYRGARAVGWALRALSGQEAHRVPWHRVVGHTGAISLRAGAGPLVQKRLLRGEGIRFVRDRVDLRHHGLEA